MGLPWVRFDTSFPKHDKVVELVGVRGGREAGFVYVCALGYCGEVESDGLIPFGALPFVHGRKRDAELLVAHGLWRPHPRGWEVVNWVERQQTAATGRQVRAERAHASRKANCVRWHGPNCGCWRDSGAKPPTPFPLSGSDPNRSPNGIRPRTPTTDS